MLSSNLQPLPTIWGQRAAVWCLEMSRTPLISAHIYCTKMYSKAVHYPQSFLMQPHIWWNYLAPPPCRITAIAAALVVPTPPLSLPPTLPISVLPHNKSNLPYPFPSSPTIKVTWYSFQLDNTQLVWKKGLFFFFKEASRFISLILSVWFLFNFLFRLSLFLTLPHFLCYDYNQVFNTLV